MHRTTNRFWKYFENLSELVQKISKKNFELLKKNPSHPSLHFKKVGKLWSIRSGINHRALALEDGEDSIWVWIGTHDEYEPMIKELGKPFAQAEPKQLGQIWKLVGFVVSYLFAKPLHLNVCASLALSLS